MVTSVTASLEEQMADALAQLKKLGRSRQLPSCSGPDKAAPSVEGKQVVSFCSNDYLGLSSHPSLIAAAASAAAQSGIGAGASRLVSGDYPEHRDLERAIARFLGAQAVLLYPTGYQTNLGVLTALAGPGDLVLSDHFNHASIIDACRLSGARPAFYRHLDLPSAEKRLKNLGPRARRRILVTESMFGMDGHFAPLPALADLAKRYDAALVVDEAHALGVYGPSGRGLCSEHQVVPDVLIGTLGKAFGAAGGFAAGSSLLRDYLVNSSRTFIYTTSIPPPVAAAAHAALTIIAGPEGQDLRATLARNAKHLVQHLPFRHRPDNPSAILPVIFGPDAAALKASQHLFSQGIFVQAIRPPTIPEGTSRLRITLSSSHNPSDIQALLDALTPILPQ
jgi:glycine C-acetyltransferase/8-amino-7-oxononanoate synthase